MTVPVIGDDFHVPDVIADPYPLFAQLRHRGSVLRHTDGSYVVPTYRAAREVLLRTADFSSANANKRMWTGPEYAEAQEILTSTCPVVPALLTTDPPLHTRHRGIVRQAFGARRVAQLESVVRETTAKLAQELGAGGHTELVAEYAAILPLQMITDAVGAGQEDIWRVKRWSDALVAHIGRPLPPPEAARLAVFRVELHEYLIGRIEAGRAQASDDLLGDVVRAELADSDGLSVPEMVGMLEQLLTAGNETSARLITFAGHQLAVDQELQARVRADRSLIPSLVEELLRLESPVQVKFRQATRNAEVEGAVIPEGAAVMVLFGSANRDGDEFPDPNTLDLARPNARNHLAFGYGPHLCVGAQLARVEARVAIETLLDRFARIAPAEDHPAPVVRASFVHRGFDELHLAVS